MGRLQLFGWIMFSLSGVVFIVIGVREGDALTIVAAILWMLGCAAFLADRSDSQ